jgi:hypothetical protein
MVCSLRAAAGKQSAFIPEKEPGAKTPQKPMRSCRKNLPAGCMNEHFPLLHRRFTKEH